MKTKKCNTCLDNFDLDKFKSKDKYVGKCEKCRLEYKKQYASNKKDKICFKCKKPTISGTHCEQCKEIHKLKARENRLIAKENNLCICCYKRTPENGKSSCRICLDSHKRNNDIIKLLFITAKCRAKRLKREFNITIDDIIIPEECPILKIKMQKNHDQCQANSYSVDRIDSSKGYIKGNVQVISHRANQLKSNGTIEELELLLEYLKSLRQP